MGGLREPGAFLSFLPKGALTHHRVGTNSISFAPPQAAGLIHSVVPPFPTKSTTLWEPFCGGGTCRWQAVYSARRMRLLRQPPDNATAPAGALLSSSAQTANSLRQAQRIGGRNSLPLLPPARTNLPPAALFAAMTRCSTSGHFLFYERETEKERTR